MSDILLYEQDGHIVTLTLNLPDMRNSLTPEMEHAIIDALERMNDDPSVRVAILTGAGFAFSSGGNVKKMASAENRALPQISMPRRFRAGVQRVPLAFEKAEVPIIAAINGHAIGVGLDLACMCDIRIAAEGAKLAESFVKLGIIPGDGGAWLLPRVVGFSKAAELTYTGDPIDAKDALACGLVSQVVPAAELLPAARKLAEKIAANPPHAVRMAKRLLMEGRHMRLDSLLEMSANMQALARATDDHREAVEAFRDKRKPKFSGT